MFEIDKSSMTTNIILLYKRTHKLSELNLILLDLKNELRHSMEK